MSTLQRSLSQYTKGRTSSPRRNPLPNRTQKVLKSGWLKKQGGNFKTWNNRWFVIRGDQMYYYQKDDELKELGMIPLPGNKVVVHQHNIDEPGKFLFDIVPGRPGQPRVTAAHETYPLWASTKDERDSWVSVIHRIIYAPCGGGVFGQALEETMMYEKKRKRTQTIPRVVEQCVDYLTKHALDMEGLFRLPGSSKTVKHLKWDYDTAMNVDLERDEVDVHSVASLLKLYFRELPEPVIPFQFYEMFLTMGLKIEHGDTRAMDTIHTLMDQLPVHNYNLLKYLCEFLYEVSEHSDQNKMPAMNLALVFGPNVLKIDDDNPTLMMSTTDLTTKTVFIFVSKHEEVFSREITDDGALSSASENLLTIDYNTMTLNRLSQGRKQSPSPNMRKKVLNNSVPRTEPPVGDLVNISDDKPVEPVLLSPETGEAKTFSADSDGYESSPIAQRISMFQGQQSVAYRTGSESRRSRRSDKIVMCQKYTGEKESSSSPESSPDILLKGNISDRFVHEISAALNARDQKPFRRLRKSSAPDSMDVGSQDLQNVDGNGMDHSKDGSASGSSFYLESSPVAPKRREKKKQNDSSSDANSEADTESLASFNKSIASTEALEFDSETVSSLLKTVASLEQKVQEQDLRHQLEVKDMRQKYEAKLKMMEDMFKEKINLLAQQLMDEKTATKQTVAKIISLQGQLQKYQMTYGLMDEGAEPSPKGNAL